MMKWLFSGLILASVLFGVLNGRMDAVTTAAISDCSKAVELTLTLAGSMCLWSGLMEIARQAGLTEKLGKIFSPVIKLLFRDLDPAGPAAQAVTLNISANLLGLGNAATPLGISAMKEMQKGNPDKSQATNSMILFVVLNTASMQLLPTTTALLRQNAGSAAPMDILPAVWVASLASVLSGIAVAKVLAGRDRRKKKR